MEKFKCKSVKLKKYLLDNGLRYIWVDVDLENKTYWVFERTPQFETYFHLYNLINSK